MVARDGRERDRDSTEEKLPDYRDPGEPVSPTEIVGAEVLSGPAEPAGSEAAEEAAEGEAARKAAEEAAAKAAEEEAARKAVEEAAVKAAKEEEPEVEPPQEVAAQEAEGEIREEPPILREPPYPVAKDSQGRGYTYQEVRAVPKEKVPAPEVRPGSSEKPPEPKEGPKKKKPRKEEPEKPEEEGKGKKGKGKGRGFRIRSEEAFHEERGEELPERVQQLLASFGPGGVSSGSRDRPRVETKPAYVPRFVLKEGAGPEAEATSDIPEPDPAVEDQRRVRVGQLTTPKKPEEKKESEVKPAEGVRLRSRSSARLHRESGRQLSNYRRRLSAAQEAVAKAKARGSVRASIRQGVYKKEGLEEACSSCDDRVKKQQEALREFASRRIAERGAKAAAEERPTRTKERKERKERKDTPKEEQKEDKNLPVIVAGVQRGESLEREIRAQTYEYLRTRKKSEAAPKAEVERKRRKEEEKKEKKEEKKKEEKEQKEKEEEKKEERKPWILKAVEKAEAAERAEAAEKADEYSYYSEVPEEEETEEEEKEEDPISEIGTPHFF